MEGLCGCFLGVLDGGWNGYAAARGKSGDLMKPKIDFAFKEIIMDDRAQIVMASLIEMAEGGSEDTASPSAAIG